MKRFITLKPCGYTVALVISETEDGTSGSIESNFKQEGDEDLFPAFDVVESLILAHACNGVDIESNNYLNGIEDTIDAIVNNM